MRRAKRMKFQHGAWRDERILAHQVDARAHVLIEKYTCVQRKVDAYKYADKLHTLIPLVHFHYSLLNSPYYPFDCRIITHGNQFATNKNRDKYTNDCTLT